MKRLYKRKLTLWFLGTTKPLRPGVYQVSATGAKHKRGAGVLYSYWNGAQWGWVSPSPEIAGHKELRMRTNTSQNRAWRGRTSP